MRLFWLKRCGKKPLLQHVYALVGLVCVSNSNASVLCGGVRDSLTDSWQGSIGCIQCGTNLDLLNKGQDLSSQPWKLTFLTFGTWNHYHHGFSNEIDSWTRWCRD